MSHLVMWTEEGEPYLQLEVRGVKAGGYRLTPIRIDDVNDYILLKNDSQVMANEVFDRSRMTRERAEKSIAKAVETSQEAIQSLRDGRRFKYTPFTVIRSPDGRLIGQCAVYDPFEPDPEIPEPHRSDFKHINFGYSIVSEYSGQGIPTAAGQALVAYCREHLESNVIGAGAQNNNPASQAILGKLGFQPVFHWKKSYGMPWGKVDLDGPWYLLHLR